jgi:heme-degrading monooxygenase HmoA
MKPPYYAVIFTSKRTSIDDGYAEIATKMEDLAKQQEGFLGVESARSDIGITVSYWKDIESIRNWKRNIDHIEAQQKGRSTWYDNYTVRIALVEREYNFEG